MSNKDYIKLEKIIVEEISNVKSGMLIPSDSNIEKNLNLMKRLNILSYKDLKDEYKSIINNMKNS